MDGFDENYQHVVLRSLTILKWYNSSDYRNVSFFSKSRMLLPYLHGSMVSLPRCRRPSMASIVHNRRDKPGFSAINQVYRFDCHSFSKNLLNKTFKNSTVVLEIHHVQERFIKTFSTQMSYYKVISFNSSTAPIPNPLTKTTACASQFQ